MKADRLLADNRRASGIDHFVTSIFDRLLPVIASIAEERGSPARAGNGPRPHEISPNPAQP
jgi:hypothetical protein